MEKIKVGTIINTHGIKGELKVARTGIEEFNRDINYYIGEEVEGFKIKYSKIHKNNFIIKLDGYDNINDVLKFKDKSIFISEEDIIDLEEDEFYVMDLIGVNVVDENNSRVGEIIDVLEYDANDVYIVSSENGEILIPAVSEFILDVDLENNLMKVKLIEGM